jgi:hypothetical protein
MNVWETSSRLVLNDIVATVSQMSKLLGGAAMHHGIARLSSWKRNTRPFERDERCNSRCGSWGIYNNCPSLVKTAHTQQPLLY